VTIDELRTAIARSLALALPDLDVSDLDVSDLDIVVERPKNRDHGDYATNVAMVLAKRAGRAPRDIAVALTSHLSAAEGIAELDIAGPGFVNIRLEAAAQGQVAQRIVEAGVSYGHGDALAGQRVNVEFISANPTGPLHLGHTRWATCP
jgi:arginyl-tRNA synthetase